MSWRYTRSEGPGRRGRGMGMRRMRDKWGIQDVMRQLTCFVVPLPLPLSLPLSVTCVSSLTSSTCSSLHFCFSLTFFKHHFSKMWNSTRKNVHFLCLSAHNWNYFVLPIVSLFFYLASRLTIPTPTARLLLFVYFSWVFLQTHSPLYPFTYISIQLSVHVPHSPTTAASLIGSLHFCALQ